MGEMLLIITRYCLFLELGINKPNQILLEMKFITRIKISAIFILASEQMMEAGFSDAFRVMYPDVDKNPGYSHRMGRRIDQLYFKGKDLSNTSIKRGINMSCRLPFRSLPYCVRVRFQIKRYEN